MPFKRRRTTVLATNLTGKYFGGTPKFLNSRLVLSSVDLLQLLLECYYLHCHYPFFPTRHGMLSHGTSYPLLLEAVIDGISGSGANYLIGGSSMHICY